jgi:glutathione S-transferase
VIDVVSQEDAVSVAGQVMEALFVEHKPDQQRDEERKQEFEAARMKGEPILEKPISRRDFLRGGFLGM